MKELFAVARLTRIPIAFALAGGVLVGLFIGPSGSARSASQPTLQGSTSPAADPPSGGSCPGEVLFVGVARSNGDASDLAPIWERLVGDARPVLLEFDGGSIQQGQPAIVDRAKHSAVRRVLLVVRLAVADSVQAALVDALFVVPEKLLVVATGATEHVAALQTKVAAAGARFLAVTSITDTGAQFEQAEVDAVLEWARSLDPCFTENKEE